MKPFRVMTFNVAGQLRFGWEQRAHLVAAVLADSGADLIGFQEFGSTNWAAYQPYLPEHQLYAGLPAGDIFINPIAWRANRFQRQEEGTRWLSQTPEIFSRGWDGAERGVSWVILTEQESGQSLLHVNVHLDNIGEQARVEGSRQVLELIEAKGVAACLLTGDFNCSPFAPHASPSYTRRPYELFLEAGFTDAYAACADQETQVPPTYHGYAGTRYVADQHATWHTDWILLRGLAVCHYQILRQDPPFPSDHYPVIADLTF